jgi:hypothetical protein
VKWGALYRDLVAVLKKHFMPETPEPDGPAVGLIQMIQALQARQKELNDLRGSTGELVKMLQDDAVLSELHRLEAMAPKESVEPVARSEDVMFG